MKVFSLVATLIRLAGPILVLVLFAVRARGQARVIGVLGAVLILLDLVLYAGVAPLLVAASSVDAIQEIYVGLNAVATLLTGAGMIMIAYAIGLSVRARSQA